LTRIVFDFGPGFGTASHTGFATTTSQQMIGQIK
jgi:hypothetical protein